ncbi:hypothetical protein NKR23_g8187 [Pleurostoma richardsiae]|uniref:Uncharacterized protein n=1 Tax=Pleurostoma richardsiae TaxID=41990 RepID=A0AA38RJC2_9PEZI|nr:hypothetical protein NKR23_g8187 [Pleurostoma richardsiae]
MKSLAVILFTVGLASAVNLASPIVQSGNIDSSLLSSALNGSAAVNGSDAAGGLDLSNLNLGDVNLGSIDLSDANSLASGIELIMNSLCLGNLIDVNSLLGLGLNNELQLFLQMAQLAQLEALGFLSVGSIQSLIQSNLLFGGGFSNVNSLNLGNFGVFKREAEKLKKSAKRYRLRRNVGKRQCSSAEVPSLSVAPPQA